MCDLAPFFRTQNTWGLATDSDVILLATLTRLKKLRFTNCPMISDTAVDALQKKLPDCKVIKETVVY